MRTKRLSSKEKEEVRAELDKINKKLYKDLQGHDLKRIKKETPEMLASIYAQLYEDGKTLVRIKERTSTNRPYEEVKKQQEIQEKWEETFASKWEDMETKIND
ncbi:1352_t:CDS:1 [Paraglomus brasilianum]|uniref:1352_t:CDS:1 n=1 Tax=Paraglomus brasilianum TaxID=144538 RepID=A0A9N9BCD0_9GLOM|nr:1352_t:CDS:1 [Paraglomus brasilianum]